jgi:hypothetical protein
LKIAKIISLLSAYDSVRFRQMSLKWKFRCELIRRNPRTVD